MRYFFRSRPFDEARRGFYRARNEERSLAQGRERERDRMENGFQQWPRVISNSTSRCNLMLVENKEKKKRKLLLDSRGAWPCEGRKSNQQLVRPLPERITLSRVFFFPLLLSRVRRERERSPSLSLRFPAQRRR